MSLPYQWQLQLEDWANEIEAEHGRLPTAEEEQEYVNSLPDKETEWPGA